MRIIKQNKIWYYIKSYARFITPCSKAKDRIEYLKSLLTKEELQAVEDRVNYYCKDISSDQNKTCNTYIKSLKKPKTPKSYYFDTYEYARFFCKNQPIDFMFGDVTEVPDTPSIVKSRPISEGNQNSVLLNLDKARHFVWVKNDKPFVQKKNLLIGRGAIFENQKNRIDFYQKYFEHPLCNLGQTNDFGNFGWKKPKISIKEHLDYKFILSLQGNDVATNLKWIMSSNSIAVMPRPTMETWFMEGKLEGGVHYIEILPDYSNLEEQLHFYIENPMECEKIIKNANEYCAKFFNQDKEDLCSLLVLEKYLR